MALKGLDYFKFTPKTNCKACGKPTCMAFCMDVAANKIEIGKCPHIKPEDLAKLQEAGAPPMKTIKFGPEDSLQLGGETVLFRHEKTFVSKNLYAVCVTPDDIDAKIKDVSKIDYVRIGERMYVEIVHIVDTGDAGKFADAAKKAVAAKRAVILEAGSAASAKAAVDAIKASKPILSGANKGNFKEFSEIATAAGIPLGVTGGSLDEVYDTIVELEKIGNKNLVADVTGKTIKETFANAVDLRRSAISGGDRTAGYPSIVNIAKVAKGKPEKQTALASLFTLKYGSIITVENMNYGQALSLYGLRQNIYTDPQKPMRVEPGIYKINGADENAICTTTVDFALTYFIVSGELERCGVPVNLIITDAGGYSVLTAWAAGKLTAGSIAKYVKEQVEPKVKCRNLILPGKVAVLKGELEENLPGWKILIGTNEAVGIVKYMKDLKA
jgi:acetyl-CoA decarbonylase/synthase complex subunit gamma